MYALSDNLLLEGKLSKGCAKSRYRKLVEKSARRLSLFMKILWLEV